MVGITWKTYFISNSVVKKSPVTKRIFSRESYRKMLRGQRKCMHPSMYIYTPSPHPLPTLFPLSPYPLPTLSSPSPHPLPTLSPPSSHSLLTLSPPSSHSLLILFPLSPHPLPTLFPPFPHPLHTLSPPSPHPLPTLSSPSPHPLPTLSPLSPLLLQAHCAYVHIIVYHWSCRYKAKSFDFHIHSTKALNTVDNPPSFIFNLHLLFQVQYSRIIPT